MAIGCQAICQYPVNKTIRGDGSDCVVLCFVLGV